MYEQQEYVLGYALVFAFLILGMLIVCIPRPRKKGFVDPSQAAKEKRQKMGQKAQKKLKKQSAKIKKKKAKSHAKKIKKKKA